MNHVADFITRLKNAALARRKKVRLQSSRITRAIAKVLKEKGFLDNVKEEKEENKKILVVTLAYESRNPVISDMEIVSKPSLRVYASTKGIKNYKKGLGITVISTNQGIMTAFDAQKKKIGGEVLFKIW